MIRTRRRTHIIRIALAVVATLLASLAPTVRAPAAPHMKGAAREPEVLQEQVVRLFDQLDRVSRVIENVQADLAWARERISELSRQIGAQQRILNRRAAEAYMAGVGGLDSVLGATSFADFQDSLEFLDAISQSDHDVLLSLEQRKAKVELERARLEALEVKLRETQERLEATAADLVEKLQRQQALLARRADEAAPDGSVGTSPSPTPLPSPSVPSSVLGRRAVTKLIRDRFASFRPGTVEVALCVAQAESGLDPSAVNPATGAAGVFQFLPSTWASLSELAGWGTASVFDARANTAVAAWTVARYGWHPWRSVAGDCGA